MIQRVIALASRLKLHHFSVVSFLLVFFMAGSVFALTKQSVESTASLKLDLSVAERAWLQQHPVIRLGIDRDFAPYEWVDDKGRYVGLIADIMTLLEQQLGIKFAIIKDKA
jgi:ABC-type amino acid transport substrate-binding protein